MSKQVRGPDGRLYTFPDDATQAEILQFFESREGGTQPQRRAIAQAAQATRERRVPQSHRSPWERWWDRAENSIQESAIYGGLSRWLVSRGNLAGSDGIAEQRDPETGQVIRRTRVAAEANQAVRETVASAERGRRQELAEQTQGDEWYRAGDGAGDKLAAGAATLGGELFGAALDPTSWIGWGRTVVTKAITQSGFNAASDAAAQGLDLATDVQDEYDARRTALAAALGGVLSLGGDLVGAGLNRLLRQPEEAARLDLEIGDELNQPALTTAEIEPTPPRVTEGPLPVDQQASGGITVETPDGTVVDIPNPNKPRSDAPGAAQEAPSGSPEGSRTGKPSEALPARSQGPEAEPKGDGTGGWDDIDWGARRSPERVAAAMRHLEGLRKWIKPEAVKDFLRVLDEGVAGASEGVHINERWVDWDAMGGEPDAILGLTNAMADIFEDVYAKAGDAKQGWEATARIAKQMGFTLSDVIKTHADITGEGGLTARTGALRDAALASDKAFYYQLKATQAAMAKGDLSGVGGLAESLHRTIVLGAMDAGASSEIARALQYRQRLGKPKFPKNDLQAAVDEINSILNKGGDLDEAGLQSVFDELAKAYEKGGSAGMRDAVRTMREMGFWDYVNYYATASLLAAPTTHIKNAFGTPIHALFQIGERYVAAGIGAGRVAVGLGSKERVTFREAIAYSTGMAQAWTEGLALGARALARGGPVTELRSSIMTNEMAAQVPFAFSRERWEGWRAKPLSPKTWADLTGVVVFEFQRSLGFRLSVATDELYKALGRRMQVNALAYREAAYRAARAGPDDAAEVFKASLKALQDEPTAAAFAEAKRFFGETSQSPEGVFAPGSREEEMALILRSIDHRQMAVDHAQLLTFQTAGRIVEKFDAALRAVPIVKGLWVNFIRTPVAILKAGIVTRNPVVGSLIAAGEMTTAHGRQKHSQTFKALFDSVETEERALARGGAEADLVLARQALGAAVLTSIWMFWASGNITGKQTEQERKSGVLDYSVRLPNGTWVQYSGMSPLGEMLGLVADTAEGMRRVDIDDDGMFAVMGALAAAIRNNIVNKTFLKGVSDFMEMMTGGSFGASDAESGGEQMSKALASAIVPRAIPGGALFRRIAQDQDPVVRDVAVMRDTQSFIDYIFSNLPGMTESLAARRDFLGRPLIRKEGERGVFQAFNTSAPTEDPLERELGSLAQTLGESFRIGMSPRKLNGEDLTPEEYSRLVEVQGQLYRVEGRNMEQTLRSLIQDPEYTTADPDSRAFQVKQVIERFRERANKAVRNPNSEFYMAEAARRTGAIRLERETRRRGWSEERALNKALDYGLAPDDPELAELRQTLFGDE